MFGSLRKGLAVSRTGLECTEAQDDLELALLLLPVHQYGPVWTSMDQYGPGLLEGCLPWKC